MITIKLTQSQAVFLKNILRYVKPNYFDALDKAPSKGAGIVHPNALKDTFNSVERQLEEQI